MSDTNDSPIRSFDDLLTHFHASARPGERRIGAEMEKFGVFRATGEPVHYAGDHGVLEVLESLAKDHGWHADRDTPGGPVLALTRSGASITLEPAAQLELSGAPLLSIHAVDEELETHLRELAPISKKLGIAWLGIGFQPFATRAELEPMVPKPRYPIMREYLPTRGGHALDMMLRTTTVQANYDYWSEADAIRKMQVALKLSPLTTAMLANSPWKERQAFGGVTYRGRTWLDVDPDRSGLVPTLWGKDASFASYVNWALDVPMFMFKRDGHKGHHPLESDWLTHLNTLFPEVRLKRTIEIRGADAQTRPLACALPALWAGIFYDDRAMDEAAALVEGWTHAEVQASREGVWREGLRATFRGAPLAKLAQRLVDIAEGGLARRKVLRADGQDERVHLARLKELVARGSCPADELLAKVPAGPGFEQRVLAAVDLGSG